MQITSSIKPVVYATQVKINPLRKGWSADCKGEPATGGRYSRITGEIESLVCGVMMFSKYKGELVRSYTVHPGLSKSKNLDSVISTELEIHNYLLPEDVGRIRSELLRNLLVFEDRYYRRVAAQRQEYSDTRKTPASFQQLLVWLHMMSIAVVPVRFRDGVFHRVDWKGISNSRKLLERDVSAIFVVPFAAAASCISRQYYQDRDSLEGKTLQRVFRWADEAVTEEIRMYNSWFSNEVYKIALLPGGTPVAPVRWSGHRYRYGADHRTNGTLQTLATAGSDSRFKFITGADACDLLASQPSH